MRNKSFLVGVLQSKLSRQNIKSFVSYAGMRLFGNPWTIEVEGNGIKLKLTIRNLKNRKILLDEAARLSELGKKVIELTDEDIPSIIQAQDRSEKLPGWVVNTIPEDWRSDLEELRRGLSAKGCSRIMIRLITYKSLLAMLWAGVVIKLENVTLPQRKVD